MRWTLPTVSDWKIQSQIKRTRITYRLDQLREFLTLCSVAVKKGKISLPKHFTEDAMLSAIETARKDDIQEDAELMNWEPWIPALLS